MEEIKKIKETIPKLEIIWDKRIIFIEYPSDKPSENLEMAVIVATNMRKKLRNSITDKSLLEKMGTLDFFPKDKVYNIDLDMKLKKLIYKWTLFEEDNEWKKIKVANIIASPKNLSELE